MKKLLLITAATLCLSGVAGAADLSARMPVKAPPVIAPVFSWTGCYIGGFVGGAWAGDYTTHEFIDYRGGGLDNWGSNTDASFIGGGTLGCNWQPVGTQFVLGLEGEAGYIDIKASAYDPYLTGLGASVKIGDWYGMITGRLGYAFDRAMIYVKGGAAFVRAEGAIYDTTTGFGVSASDTMTTWTVGGGIEWAFAPSWSVKAEYMYIALDDTTSSCGFAGTTDYCWGHDHAGISTAKVGLNYRFGGFGAPVVARY